jgi:two-component system, chemotaxis family, CheB/CheR fusion protein
MGEIPRRRGRTNNKHKNTGKHSIFLAGLGASAGGIHALEQFFEHMPPDSNLAFVVILHLSPEHESNLAPMLQRKTLMPVIQVQERIKVLPNHVYVIPPVKHLAMEDGHIRLMEPEQQKGRRVPVDLFFRTLAEAYTTHAIGVIFSGTGTDGTIGLRRIKEKGGIAIAQDPLEAEYDGMPRSVINAGLVDFVLPVVEIPTKLIALRQATEQIQIWHTDEKAPVEVDEKALRGVLATLRTRTNHDFSSYKRSTVLRRVARRLQINNLQEVSQYQTFIRENPGEAQELLKDMLISVTNFFRDNDAYNTLKAQVIPKIFEQKELGDQVRVWVSGCATGEEAYSMAILLSEYAETLDHPPNLQIFATDIDEEGITEARDGIFPESIEADVSLERLRRFFHKESHHYRIRKEVREMVLFAPHNVLRDPPFSKIDLISCRNLLIYLNREAQERVMQIFHFALRPNAYLFLGASESAENLPELYTPVEKKHRIYKRRAVATLPKFLPEMPVSGRWEGKLPDIATTDKKPFTYSELHHAILERYAPPSVLINKDYDIVHLSENVGRYLRFVGGEPTRNLLKAVHPDLRLDLRTALFAAAQGKEQSEVCNVRVKLGSNISLINILVRRIEPVEANRTFMLVIFDDVTSTKTESEVQAAPDSSPTEIEMVVRQMDEELLRTKDQLRTTIEQYETSTEELKASNEELQAINEELRSTTEELETSKEELQSVNEELTTVNHELKEKVDEISRFNSDLQNLLTSTDIGTIFLDRNLYIRRFTPRVQDLFNIISSDINRPFTHLTHKLVYPNLAEDAAQVLKTLARVEREIRSLDGNWYIARLLPYRTLDDKIDGVVLTFLDITKLKTAEGQVKGGEERWRLVVESMEEHAIFAIALDGRISSWNSGAQHIFGYSESEAIGMPAEKLFTPEDRAHQIPEQEMKKALIDGRANNERWHIRKDGSLFYASGVMTLMRDSAIGDFVKILRDLTEQKQQEEALQKLNEELENRVRIRTNQLENSYHILQEEMTERRASDAQVKELLRRVVGAQEIERHRISRDLHDMFGQQLTALRLNLSSVKERLGEQSELQEQLGQTQELAKQIDADLDFLAWELRPASLDELGLVAAIEGFIQDWSKHFGIAADFHTAGLAAIRLQSDIEINLYRIAQEALNNIYKHAEASQVDIILEHRDKSVVLIIEDNGKGFNPNEKINIEEGLGLISMRERAALVGGTLEIEATPGKGTTIFSRIPIQLPKRKKS